MIEFYKIEIHRNSEFMIEFRNFYAGILHTSGGKKANPSLLVIEGVDVEGWTSLPPGHEHTPTTVFVRCRASIKRVH